MPENVIEPLQGLLVDIASLNPDPANARLHGPRNMDAVKASLSKFGQRMPIVIQKQGMIVRAGNARLQAAKDLGWDRIAAVVVDENDVSATAYAIADNRTGELAEWGYETLSETLKSLESEGFDLQELGWEDFEIGPLLQADWTPPEAEHNNSDFSLSETKDPTAKVISIVADDVLCDGWNDAVHKFQKENEDASEGDVLSHLIDLYIGS